MYNPQLETFIRVADAGSFIKAAEDLFITPPAVIKQINSLEASLDLKLFIRTHRGLTLTQAGTSLYRDAAYMIRYGKESVQRARDAMRTAENLIRIGTSPLTPGQFLVDLWPKIHPLCPNMKFTLVPFENTPENAREILRNLGQNIDLVAGVFDEAFLASRHCSALELFQAPVRCAVSIRHRLAGKESIALDDLAGEDLMLIRRGWNRHVDQMRDDISAHCPHIHITDFDFYNVDAFNQCEHNNAVMMAIDNWLHVHPMFHLLSVQWDYTIPFGLLHSPTPSDAVEHLLQAVRSTLSPDARIQAE